ncbi:MAG: S8 family serine peptidase [Bacteroidota bacterium]
MKKILFLITVLVFSISHSQTRQQKQEITKDYNFEKLSELSSRLLQKQQADKQEALRLAVINNWQVRYSEDGVDYELKCVSEEGNPIYFKTFNANAAKSTRANQLHSGGTLGLNVEGQNMTGYVWDSGIARATHQEYDGAGGTNRFSAGGDGAILSDHSAHVMGTIIASGVQSTAKGMAPQAYGIGYDWTGDMGECTVEAANGMLISNHSYGVDESQIPDWEFGAYTFEAQQWDEILYTAPYYMMVVAAGNAGYDNSSNGDPLGGNAYYDKLTTHSTAKNNMVVANANDANVSSDGTLISVSINAGSSEGPTDDLRIKPDITGNGTMLYSTLHNSDTSYGSYTGTSMSSPNVAGSLLILQQHYNDVNGTFMRASTLKGLTLHTADDAGPNGPDAVWGWGLMNTKAAAQAISQNSLGSVVYEGSLNDGESYTITVESDNVSTLMASISWTDVPGIYNSGVPNDPTPVLVNDLDVRVSNGTDYEPWKLTGVTTNSQGDNIVDTFERVDVAGASGTYTITVTHKGSLTNGKQDFALVITGVDSQFTFTSDNPVLEECAPNNAEFDFNFVTATGSTSNTTFSADNVPSGASASFSPTAMNSDGSFTMTISGLTNVTPGEYTIDVTATNASETETHQVTLFVYNPTITTPTLLSPANGATNIPYSIDLTWTDDLNAQTYDVEVAEDAGFNTIVFSDNIDAPRYSALNLENNMTYYWRVKPNNICASGSYTAGRSFTTTDACISYNYTGSALSIPDSGTPVSTTFTVSESFTVEDVNVYIDISHDDVGALLISLESPSGTSAYVSTPDANCDAQNILANFDEAGLPITCDEEAPIGYYGNLQASESLTDEFSGEPSTGVWTLTILDLEPGITGTLNDWTLNVCDDDVVGTDEFEFDTLNIWPNPTTGEVSISLDLSETSDVNIELIDMSGRLMSHQNFTNTSSNFKENVNFGNLSNGVYIVRITNGNKVATRKLLIEKN